MTSPGAGYPVAVPGAPQQQQYKVISMNPDTFVQGGLVQDVDVRIDACYAELFNYGGKIQGFACTVRADCVNIDSGEKVELRWSMGTSTDFIPHPSDRRYVVSIAGAEGARKGSNWSVFLDTLINAGLDKTVLNDGFLGRLEGLEFHVVRPPAPKRPGIEHPEAKYEQTIPCVSKVIRWPWSPTPPSQVPRRGAGTAPVLPALPAVPGAVVAGPGLPVNSAAAAGMAIPQVITSHDVGVLTMPAPPPPPAMPAQQTLPGASAMPAGPGPGSPGAASEDYNKQAVDVASQVLQAAGGAMPWNSFLVETMRLMVNLPAQRRTTLRDLLQNRGFLAQHGITADDNSVVKP